MNADNTFASLAGKDANGAIGAMLTTEYKPTPALISFRKRYKARFHVDATPFAVANYGAVMLIGTLVKKIDSTDASKLNDVLNSVTNYKGLQGTVSFSPQ